MSEGAVKARYDKFVTTRNPYLMRARQCSTLTVPSLVPPEGSSGSTILPTPYQSLGARGLNNLSAKLLLTLLPPNTPFFRYTISDLMLEQMTGQEGMRAQIEEALDRMERAVMQEIETTAIRVPAFEALKQLLVAGNVLLYLLPEGGMKMFRLDRYVCKRDPMGNVLEIVTKENMSAMELPNSIRQSVLNIKKNQAGANEDQDTIELYTQIKRTPTKWEIVQEVCGIEVPGSRGSYPLKKSPWVVLRFVAIDSEDYGRGYVEEYLGDLKSLEGLTKAIVQGSAAAAKVLFLVKANSTTKHKVLAESESGDIREGNGDDVTVLQLEKYADFKVALETIKGLEERLSYAFLLNSSIQRNGERVTAEEIRFMANELETALGGVYSTQSQEFQLPLVICVSHRMELKGKLPVLPEGAITPMITTGVEALGRGNDLTKLAGLAQDLAPFGPEALQMYFNVDDYAKRCGAARGIDMKGLIPTKEEIAAKQQQNQMTAMVHKLGPNAINAMGGMAKEGMKQSAAPDAAVAQ
jgi:hypothetical protein